MTTLLQRPLVRSLLATACALATAGLAQAQSSPTVDVRAKADLPRVALREACPQALAELPDALAVTAQDVATASLVTVRFEIEGGRLHQLQTQGGVGRQARAVQRAVRALGCSNGDAGRQVVQFQVRFLDPFDRSTSQALALVDLSGR